jgi:chromosome partitioning protein
MVPSRPQARGEQLRADLLEQNIPLFNAQIPRLSAFEKAAEKGIRVCDVKSNKNAQRAWEAYVSAGKEIING